MAVSSRSRAARAWILWASALLCLIALAWMGAVLVVRARVGRDLAELQRTSKAAPPSHGQDVFQRLPNAYYRILDRGCPALPRLVDELDPGDDPAYTANLSRLIRGLVLGTHGGPDAALLLSRMNDMMIDAGEAPEDRARKVLELRRWWKDEGASRHPAWRFWSSSGCRTPIAENF